MDDDAQMYIAEYESALQKEYQRGYDAGKKAAQPAQEPDVVMHWESHTWTTLNPPPKGSGDVNLYYAPAPAPAPQRPWVGLTNEKIEELFQSAADADEETHIRFARAVEQYLKDKNT